MRKQGPATYLLEMTDIPIAGIKQKSRYNFNICSGLCILVGPARFELATNGLKVRCSTG